MLLGLSLLARPPFDLLPERARSGALAANFFAPPRSSTYSTEHWLSVPLDWTDKSSPKFEIRYFVDKSVFDPKNASSPIFVSMGGEGTSSGARCSEIARKHKALCVSVEHRFYGKSVPAKGGVETSNYRAGLYVEQNLADTAAVIDAVQAAHRLEAWPSSTRRPVVNFGGSYSGATCAWFRQAFPTKTLGCVSSSGVVNALLDFPQFDTQIARALSSPDGAACPTALHLAFRAIDRAFAAGDGAKVKALFNASNLIGTPLGDTDFYYAAADGAAMIDQYGGKAELCRQLATLPEQPDDTTRIANLAGAISHHYGPHFAADCFYDSECLRNTTGGGGGAPSQLGGTNSRSWRWQKCAEVGFLQRAPTAHAPSGDDAVEMAALRHGALEPQPLRSVSLTLDALQAQCDHVFGPGTAGARPPPRAPSSNASGVSGGGVCSGALARERRMLGSVCSGAHARERMLGSACSGAHARERMLRIALRCARLPPHSNLAFDPRRGSDCREDKRRVQPQVRRGQANVGHGGRLSHLLSRLLGRSLEPGADEVGQGGGGRRRDPRGT